MDNIKNVFYFILVVVIGWHAKVYFINSNTSITGFLQAKPDLGYVWENEVNSNIGGLGCTIEISKESKYPYINEIVKGSPAEKLGLSPNDFIIKINDESTADLPLDKLINDKLRGSIGTNCNITVWRNNIEYPMSFTRARIKQIDNDLSSNIPTDADTRFFWSLKDVKWQPGFLHPNYKVQAAEMKNEWVPIPGYVFVNGKEGDFETVWKSGLLHPNIKAWASDIEGKWIPVTGYKFIMDNGVAVDAVWDPEKSYDDLKIISGNTKDTYYAFPGYRFVNPGQNLRITSYPT